MTCTARYLSFVKRRSLENSADVNDTTPAPTKKLVCTTDGNTTTYSFTGDIVTFFDGKGGLEPGYTQLTVPSGLIDSTSQSIDLNGDTIDSSDTILVSTIKQATTIAEATGIDARRGTHTVLVLRVTDTRGTAPTRSAAEIASDVFTDSLNLVGIINALNLFSNRLKVALSNSYLYRNCSLKNRKVNISPALRTN